MPKTRHDNRSHGDWLNKEKAGRDAGLFCAQKKGIYPVLFTRSVMLYTASETTGMCLYGRSQNRCLRRSHVRLFGRLVVDAGNTQFQLLPQPNRNTLLLNIPARTKVSSSTIGSLKRGLPLAFSSR